MLASILMDELATLTGLLVLVGGGWLLWHVTTRPKK